MNAYVLKRVAAFALAFVALELLASVAWLLLHGADRATVRDSADEIGRLSAEIAVERAWLAERASLGASLDTLDARIRTGLEAFDSREELAAARARQAERVQTWNAGIAEHESRAARVDSLGARHDSLVRAWGAAVRRAYPGWLLLPRPDPPRQVPAP